MTTKPHYRDRRSRYTLAENRQRHLDRIRKREAKKKEKK